MDIFLLPIMHVLEMLALLEHTLRGYTIIAPFSLGSIGRMMVQVQLQTKVFLMPVVEVSV